MIVYLLKTVNTIYYLIFQQHIIRAISSTTNFLFICFEIEFLCVTALAALELALVDKGWPLTYKILPVSASLVLGLKVCAVTAASTTQFFILIKGIIKLGSNLTPTQGHF